MDWTDFGAALALVLIIEGTLPFLSPEFWQKMAQAAGQLNPKALRMMGLMFMLTGLTLLTFIRKG